MSVYFAFQSGSVLYKNQPDSKLSIDLQLSALLSGQSYRIISGVLMVGYPIFGIEAGSLGK